MRGESERLRGESVSPLMTTTHLLHCTTTTVLPDLILSPLSLPTSYLLGPFPH